MSLNGSPEPTFDTNKDSTYFLTTIPARIEIEEAVEGAKMVFEVNSSSKNKFEGAVEGAVKGVTKGTKSKIVILLKAIINSENERVPYYVKLTGMPAKTIERYMKLLRENELIDFSEGSTHH